MGKYIHLFETETEFNSAYTGDNYDEPWVSYTMETSGITYNKSEYEKLLGTPLTFKIISAGTINWVASNSSFTKTIEYKKNDGEWTEITSNTGVSAPAISVASGDKVQFRGDNISYCNHSYEDRFNRFSGSTTKFTVEGNIMSLINSTAYTTQRELPAQSYSAFRFLFSDCSGLISAEKLILPISTLAKCYYGMFQNCTSLTTAPALPATTMAPYCYYQMFYGCTSLTTAPELPATTLGIGDRCYMRMFQGCTSLTTAPSTLPATTLTNWCYGYMFYGCTSLTTAPELPALTLKEKCYCDMFGNCTNINRIKCLATDISASSCTAAWVDGVQTNSGTFIKNPSMSSWTTGNDGIPSNWTVEDAS